MMGLSVILRVKVMMLRVLVDVLIDQDGIIGVNSSGETSLILSHSSGEIH